MRSSLRTLSLFGLLILSTAAVWAAAPMISSTSPLNNAMNISATSDITINFNQAMNTTTLTTSTIKVYGSLKGFYSGAVTTTSTSATFNPDASFKSGEVITVIVTTGVLNSGDEAMAKGYVTRFIADAQAGGNALASKVHYAVGDGPNQVISADVDNDGDNDLIAANYANTVSVLINNGSGTFAAAANYSRGGSNWNGSVISADVNSDGYVDLIAINNNYVGNLAVLLNNGDGTFASAVTYTMGPGSTSVPDKITSGDVDGDGDIDLVGVNSTFDSLFVVKNNGSGVFSNSQRMRVGDQPTDVILADLDLDGDLDVVTVNMAANTLSVLHNNGSGTLTLNNSPSVGSSPRQVAAVDVDGDGILDLVVTNHNAGTISVLDNALGNGTSFTSMSTPGSGSFPIGIVGMDIDSDSDMDLIVTTENNVGVLKNNGSGTFASVVKYSTGNSPYSVAVSDLNGDGGLDVITANWLADSVSVLMNVLSQDVTTNAVTNLASTSVTLNGTVNANGTTTTVKFAYKENTAGSFLDTIVATPSTVTGSSNTAVSANLTGLVPNRAYNFKAVGISSIGTVVGSIVNFQTTVVPFGVSSISPSHNALNVAKNTNITVTFSDYVDWANINSDANYPKLIVTGSLSGRHSIQMMSHAFTTATVSFNPDQDFIPGEVVTVSVGYGISEDQTYGANPGLNIGKTTLYTFTVGSSGTGRAYFSSSSSFSGSQPDSTVRHIYPVDYNRDGNVDFISHRVTSSTDYIDYLRKNSGQDSYTASSYPRQFGGGFNFKGLGLGDFNMDGYMDIVAFYALNNTTAYTVMKSYYGDFDNSSTVTEHNSSTLTNANNTGGIVTDFNNDGYPDVALKNSSVFGPVLFGNAGYSTYALSQYGTFKNTSTADMVTADLNNDKFTDFVGANGDTVGVLLSTGWQTIGTTTAYRTSAGSSIVKLAVGDVDGDGDIDVVTMNSASGTANVTVLKNNGSGVLSVDASYSYTGTLVGMKVADMDADGDLDIVVGNATTMWVAANNGSGNFSSSSSYSLGAGVKAVDVAVTDADADGDLDFAFFDANNNVIRVLRNSYAPGTEPAITAVSPAKAAVNVSGTANITVTFNQAMLTSTLSTSSIKVYGSIRGYYSGAVTTSSTSATFNPDSTFLPGEEITVTVTTGVQSSNTVPLLSPYSWAFYTATQAGSTDLATRQNSSTNTNPTQVVAADIDKNGLVDLISVNLGANNISVLKNTGGGSFATKVDYATGSYARSLDAADFDRDGDVDIVVSNYSSVTVSVFFNNGDGTFASKVDFATGSQTWAVTTADVDGDGYIDIVGLNPGAVQIMHNNGNGTFSSAVTYATGSNAETITTGDVNGDGAIDVIVGRSTSQKISILLNNGNGTFAAYAELTEDANVNGMVTADVNGDGALDIIAGMLGASNKVRVLINDNNGNGTFGTTADYTMPEGVYSVAVTDADIDGDLDIVASTYAYVSLLKNNGDGTFGGRKDYSGGSWSTSIVAADINGDGVSDVVTTNYAADNISVMRGMTLPTVSSAAATSVGSTTVTLNGSINAHNVSTNASFAYKLTSSGSYTDNATATPSTVTGSSTTSISADVTGLLPNASYTFKAVGANSDATVDGSEEQFTTNAVAPDVTTSAATGVGATTATLNGSVNANNSSTVSKFLYGTASGVYTDSVTAAESPVNNGVSSAGISKALSGLSPLTTYYYKAIGTNSAGRVSGSEETFTTVDGPPSVSSVSPVANVLNAPASANIVITFDRSMNASSIDGNIIVRGSMSGKHAGAVTGSGSVYTFDPTSNFTIGEEVTVTVKTGVANANDIAMASPYAWKFRIAAGQASGNFVSTTDYGVGATPNDIVGADIDNDGDVDLITSDGNSSSISVIKNNGDGTFATRAYYITPQYTRGVEAADLNNDGWIDLISAQQYFFNGMSVFMNNGDGTFATAVTYQTGTGATFPNSNKVKAADFDGDGDMDLVVLNNQNDGSVSVYLNNGNGTFAARTNYAVKPGTPATYAVDMAIADFDSDGDLDMFTVNNYSQTYSLLKNNGNGTFATAIVTTSSHQYNNAVSSADMDGDGDADIVVAGANLPEQVHVLTNDGTGTFTDIGGPQQNYGTGALSLADIDGDNDIDAVTNSVYTLKNNGSGTLTGTSVYPLFGGGGAGIMTADLDGNGQLDFAQSITNNNSVQVFLSPTKPIATTSSATNIGYFTATMHGSVTSRGASATALFAYGTTLGSYPDTVTATPSPVDNGETPVSVSAALSGLSVGTKYYYKTIATHTGGTGSGAVDSFTTIAGPPMVTAKSPAANAMQISASSNVQVTFSEAMDSPTMTGNFRVSGSFHGEYSGSITNVDNTYTFDPSVDFKPGEVITVSVSTGVDDADGNPMPYGYLWSFTVQTATSASAFSAPVSYSSGSYVSKTPAVGDVDGDGNVDLAVALPNVSTVGILKSNGDGTFASATTYGVQNNPSMSVFADVDRDGHLDVAVNNIGSGSISVLLNEGDGTFGTAVNYSVQSNPTRLRAADVNGDGYVDLVVAHETGNVAVLMNNGNGTFATAVMYSGGAQYSSLRDISAGDIDGDGDLDLVASNYGLSKLSVLKNNGNGTFASYVDYTVGDYGESMVLADANGDGHLDAMVAHLWTNDISVLLNNGDGTFASPAVYNKGGYTTGGLAGADIDGDGDIDLIGTDGGWDQSMKLMLNNGNGTFASAVSTEKHGSGDVALTDLNGDGKVDLLYTDNGSYFRVSLNAPAPSVSSVAPMRNALDVNANANIEIVFTQSMNTGSLSSTTIKAVGSISGLHSGSTDFSNSNKTVSFNPDNNFTPGEMVTVTVTTGAQSGDGAHLSKPSSWMFVVATGDGDTQAPNGTVAVGTSPKSAAFADLDNDNDLDMLVANSGSDNVTLLMNNGSGTFTSGGTSSVGSSPVSVIAADLNADGSKDMIVANNGSDNISVRLNDGTGAFPMVTNYSVGTAPTGVVSADIDGDGDADVIVANSGSDNVSVLLNNGSGSLGTAVNYTVGSIPSGVTVADVDNDGDLDVVAVNGGDNNVSVLKNSGSGTFAAAVNYAAGSEPSGITSGDVDGDGDADLMVSSGSNNVSVLLNSGSGTFVAAVDYAVGTSPQSVSAGDVDGDGDLDLVTANYGSGNVSLLKNNGNGTFATAQSYSAGTNPVAAVLASVNGDTNVDLIAVNSGSDDVTAWLNVASPQSIASGLSFSSNYGSQMKMSWSPGNGTSRIVVIKQGASVDGAPVNNTTYTANAAFGSGAELGTGNFVVYNGTGDHVTITGLTTNTQYTATVYEYNSRGSIVLYGTASSGVSATTNTVAGYPFDTTAGKAVSFDGQWLVTNNTLALGNSFTVEFWAKPSDLTAERTVLVHGDGGLLVGFDATGHVYGKVYDEGAEDYVTVTGSSTAVANKWYHIALMGTNGSPLKLYVNGVLEETSAENIGTIETSTDYIYPGGDYNTATYRGDLDELRLWSSERTTTDIRTYMHKTLSGFPANLSNYWQFNEGSSNRAYDLVGDNRIVDYDYFLWVNSGAPVGGATVALSSGVQNGSTSIGNATLDMADGFDNPVDVFVSEVSAPPSNYPAGFGGSIGSKYFVINLFGTPGTFSANVSFNFGPGVITPAQEADPGSITLFKRESNSSGTWAGVGGAVSAVSSTGVVTWTGITSFSQFIALTSDNKLPPSLTLTKVDYANWQDVKNQDRITAGVWLTRQNKRGIYNIRQESIYDDDDYTSPAGTEWAAGKLSDGVENLTFDTWNNTTYSNWGDKPNMVDHNMVLHLTAENVYLDITFNSWTSNNNGGGFSYTRSLLPVEAIADGLVSVQSKTETSASLKGRVYSKVATASAYLVYGTASDTYTDSVQVTEGTVPMDTLYPVTAHLTGLTSGTTYYYRLGVWNGVQYLRSSELTVVPRTVIVSSKDDGTMTISKPDYADYTNEKYQDRLTKNVWITRQDDRGIFNILQEEQYDRNERTSPLGTEWAAGTIADGVENLSFSSWHNTTHNNWGNKPNMVGHNMVLHLIEDDVYLDIKFNSWTDDGDGGGFSYTRSLMPLEIVPGGLQSLTSVTPTSATVKAQAYSKTASATVYVVYGTLSNTYTDSVQVTQGTIPMGSLSTVSATMSGLTAGTTYYYRFGMSNGTQYRRSSEWTVVPHTVQVWSKNDGTLTFSKEDNVDYSLPENQDQLSDLVSITRPTEYGGIVNILSESNFSGNSPAGTEWAMGTTANLSSLSFQPWMTAINNNPIAMLNQDMVMHLIDEDIYLDVKFTSWSLGGGMATNGGPKEDASIVEGKKAARSINGNESAMSGYDGFAYVRAAAPFAVLKSTVTGVTSAAAVLNGSVYSQTHEATARFLYGTSSGTYTDSVVVNVPSISANSVVPVSANLSSLKYGTQYHFRLAASNEALYQRSSEGTFMTMSPSPGNALRFDGADDYVSLSPGVYFSGNFTVETWVNEKSYKSWSRILDFGNGPGNNNIVIPLSVGGSGKIALHVYDGGDVQSIEAPDPLPLNTWNHVAIVMNNGTATIYINGVAVVSGEVRVAPNVVRNYNYIGKSNWNDEYADATMEEFRVWNVARSEQEIRDHMYSKFSQPQSGLSVYLQFNESSGSTVSNYGTTPNGRLNNFNFNASSGWLASTIGPVMPAVTSFGGVTNNDATVIGTVYSHDAAASAYMLYGTMSGIYTDSVPMTPSEIPSGGTTTVWASVTDQLSPGTLYYTVIAASDGSVYQRSTARTFMTASSQPANALRFDGGDDYVRIPDNNALDLTSTYTIEAWIKPSGFNFLGGIVSKYHSGGADGYMLRMTQTSPFSGINFDGMETENGILNTGQWYHIAAVNQNGTRTLYVNGSPVSLSGGPITTASNSDPVTIGVDYLPSGRYFQGVIDEVRIWNVARTQQEITDHMNAPFLAAPEGLVAYFQLNEFNGTIAHNLSSTEEGTLNNFNFNETSGWEISTAPLPVELGSFTVTAQRFDAELKWGTISEVSNYGFDIERKRIGDIGSEGTKQETSTFSWTKAGFVEGHGTSSSPQQYSFSDRNLRHGRYQYRLKQIDQNGAFKYSPTVEVTVGTAPMVFALSQNYPNPFNPSTTIEFTIPKDGMTTLKVYNALGQEVATLVNEELKAGEYHQSLFNAQNLASGIYFARLQNGGKVQIRKMMLLK